MHDASRSAHYLATIQPTLTGAVGCQAGYNMAIHVQTFDREIQVKRSCVARSAEKNLRYPFTIFLRAQHGTREARSAVCAWSPHKSWLFFDVCTIFACAARSAVRIVRAIYTQVCIPGIGQPMMILLVFCCDEGRSCA